MVGLGPTIHRSASSKRVVLSTSQPNYSSGEHRSMDPRDKPEDDNMGTIRDARNTGPKILL
jgi:hypothetical protein